MHYKKLWITSCILAAGLTMNLAGVVNAADAETGELIFAQCESYINIRSEADENSEVVAKLYNDGSATVEETDEDGWYKIKSGNAIGYVKSEYFATGEQAKEIADKVAYNVAVVNAKALNVRATPSEESTVIDVASESEELEVVDTSGEWATVALGNDVYGFIHPDYCEYKTYYPTAVTLEEEADRQAAEEASYKEVSENTDISDSEDVSYAEDTASADATYTDETPSTDTAYVDETPSTDTAYVDETPSTEAPYTEVPETEAPYTEAPETEAPYTEAPETEAPETEAPETEAPETEAPETEAPETEAPETEAPETEAPETEAPASDSSVGQEIANYAVQFVGNPYVYGGTSLTNGTDCSGFTQSVMANFGIYIARTAADQAYGGTSVSVSDIQPGDLLFYSDGSGISHVALYIGGGQIVHAATESQGIIISSYNYDSPVCAARYW
ncbi:C40 family peptidase [Jingyaoa shaoxingensis]|uniref:C40 family peptidase n=1 Tax=Jingyaoa shaoxingensis TaxID=2763671 RepID=A0ABR7N8J3_9FIRM|nr:C40 family peptidase [Jingyaoa shaoxingensis]MBC8572693.1 C40 family peptidase [Jingyaoa shaoxingensis]